MTGQDVREAEDVLREFEAAAQRLAHDLPGVREWFINIDYCVTLLMREKIKEMKGEVR